jgi:hypothetical protein
VDLEKFESVLREKIDFTLKLQQQLIRGIAQLHQEKNTIFNDLN